MPDGPNALPSGTMISRRLFVTAWSVAILTAPAACCKTAAQTRQDEREAAERAEALREQAEAAREAQERQRITTSPDDVLQTSDIQYYDKGIINDYRTLTAVTVLNKSRFALNNLIGEVDWLDQQGRKFGSIPFALKGSIPAGDTKTFTTAAGTLTNGTIQADAKRARLRFTHVEIVDAR